jgi:hypothetical protein
MWPAPRQPDYRLHGQAIRRENGELSTSTVASSRSDLLGFLVKAPKLAHQPKGITADHSNYLRLWADCGHGVGIALLLPVRDG